MCVCVATDALRKLRFPANFSGHKRAPGSRWLRARWARADCSCGQLRNRAPGSHFFSRYNRLQLPDQLWKRKLIFTELGPMFQYIRVVAEYNDPRFKAHLQHEFDST